VRAGVLALIVKALILMYKECPKNLFCYIVMGAAFIAVAVFKINVIIVIALSAAAGIASAFLAEKKVRV
jgi:chromate transporter